MEEEIRFITVDEGMAQVLSAIEEELKEKQAKRNKLVMCYCEEAIKRAVKNAIEKLSISEMKSDIFEEMNSSDVTENLKKTLREAGWIIEWNGHGGLHIVPTEKKIQEYEARLRELKKRYEE